RLDPACRCAAFAGRARGLGNLSPEPARCGSDREAGAGRLAASTRRSRLMPKLSELGSISELNGTEALPAIIEVAPDVYANVLVPLSVVMALLDGATFDNIGGAPGDNAALAAALAAKAPLASPALTGTPTAPTASAATNTTQLATTAFVQAAITALINSAP